MHITRLYSLLPLHIICYVWSRSVRAETKECFLLPLFLFLSPEPLWRPSTDPLGTLTEEGTRSCEGRREEPWGRAETRGWWGRRGTQEERRIRGASQRRNRLFHLYAARIQLTLHLLLSFFFSSRWRVRSLLFSSLIFPHTLIQGVSRDVCNASSCRLKKLCYFGISTV